MKFYQYEKCATCRKAKKYLEKKGIVYDSIAIRETPPTKAELKAMLEVYGGELKKLFNTSGKDYQEMGIKDKLTTMTENEALELLSGNGNLIKLPFVLTDNTCMVGFKEEVWDKRLS